MMDDIFAAHLTLMSFLLFTSATEVCGSILVLHLVLSSWLAFLLGACAHHVELKSLLMSIVIVSHV